MSVKYYLVDRMMPLRQLQSPRACPIHVAFWASCFPLKMDFRGDVNLIARIFGIKASRDSFDISGYCDNTCCVSQISFS
jgi:hypothetical protein